MTPPDQLDTQELGLDRTTAALLDAVIAMSSDLDLHSVLDRIVLSAIELVDAESGALGVVGRDGTLVDRITRGVDRHDPGLVDRPSGDPTTRSSLRVPVRIRGTVFGNLYLTRKRGGAEFTGQDAVLLEAVATAAGYVIENARAYGLSELRRAWLEATAELTEVLQPPIDHGVALARLTAMLRSLTRARAVVFVTRGDGGPIVATAVDPDDEELVRGATLALLEVGPEALHQLVDCHARGLSGVAAPVPARLARPGGLLIFQDEKAPIEPEERELLVSFAEQVALALDRAEAIGDRADLAVVTDRERIARDLHDVVIQRLFATGLQLQGLGMMVQQPELIERLDAAVDALDQTVKDIRGTIFELHQRRTDSLRAEVRDIVREYVGALGFTPAVRTTGPVDTAVPDRVRDHLTSVLREAVSNVARHALADSAEVELTVGEDQLRLLVLDDGVGVGAGPGIESGLRNARRRANELGGSFELTGREPRGTSFSWTVPLTPA